MIPVQANPYADVCALQVHSLKPFMHLKNQGCALKKLTRGLQVPSHVTKWLVI